MTLLFSLFNLFGSREYSDNPRNKHEKFRRSLRFESLEDRKLLAAGDLISGDFYVDPGETEIIDGVEYSVPETETGSLKLTPDIQYNVSTGALLEENVIITNNDLEKAVQNFTVSGTYSGKVDGVDGTGTTYFGRIFDDTTANVTIKGKLPYFVKRDHGTITVSENGNVTEGLAGKSGKNVDVVIENGGSAYLASIYTSYHGVSNYLRNITVKAGGIVPYAAGVGDQGTTTVEVEGGTLVWQNNPKYSTHVKSFSMSSGSMELRNGVYSIDQVTGGTILCNAGNTYNNAYTFNADITNATVTLQKFNSATFAGNVSSLVVGNGQTPITIAEGKTVSNLTLNGIGSVTLNGNATTMTVDSGNAVINSTASIGTLNVNGGSVIFSAGFTDNTTYKIATYQSLIDGNSNTLYFNDTDALITTTTPTSNLKSIDELYRFDNKSGYYVTSGTADVVVDEAKTTWTFKDGSLESTGTVYAFYGTNTEKTLTLEAGATASYYGVEITPYSPNGGTPDNVQFVLEDTGIKVTSGIAQVSGKGSVRLGKGITAYASVADGDKLKVYLYCENKNNAADQSKIIYDGLIASREYGNSQSYVGFIGISPGVLEIGEQMAGTRINPVDGIKSTSTVINKVSPGYLYADVPAVEVNEYGILIYSDVETVTVNGENSYATVKEGGHVTNAILGSGKKFIIAEGSGRIDSITLNSSLEPRNLGNVRLLDTSSVGEVTMLSGTYLRFQTGVSVGDEQGDLILDPNAILQRFTNDGSSDTIAYTVLANTQMPGKVNADGSSVFTLANENDVITVNGLNYTAKANNTVVNISVDGAVTGNLTVESGVLITTLEDVVSDEDQYISLREAIDYARANISWEMKENSYFAPTYYGYDFSTGSFVQGKDMVEDGEYYIPVRSDGRDVYDGKKESIEAAFVRFDAALASETNLTITLNNDLGDLTIDQSIVIDGKIGDRSVTIDRGLIVYDADKFDLYEVCQGEADLSEIWKVTEGNVGVYGRVLNLTETVPVALSNLTLQGAHNNADGGAIYSKANLTLANVSIVGNVFTVTDTTGTDKFGVGIWNDGGTISMYGGSLEGNWANGDDDNEGGTVYSVAVSSTENSLYFDDVEVLQNKVADGSFIYTNCDEKIVIKNTHVYKNSGNVFDGAFASDYVITDSLFEDNYGGGNFWFRGEITITDSVFNNSGYDPAINGYTSEDEYYNYYAAFLNEGGTEDDPNTFNITNSLFNKVAFELVYNSTYTVFTMNNCTVTGCNDDSATSKVGFIIYDDEDVNIDSTVNVTLNDTLLLGNGIDLRNQNTGANITITVNDSIVGYYDDARNDVLTKTDSIVEVYDAGSVEFVQTSDPDAPGYYEAATATVNGQAINLLGTSEGGDTVSVLGYNYGVATDLTMQKIMDDFYTTVTTLEDKTDSADGVISLREAVIYAEANSDRPLTITFDENLADAEGGPTIKLGSNLDITTDNISIDGTLKNGKVVNIDKDGTVTGDVRLVNQGTLSLSDINLQVGLIGGEDEDSTTVSGNVSLGYFAGPNADTTGCLSVEQTTFLTITTIDDSDNESVYLIHHDTLLPSETTGAPLFLFATDGTIGSYKIGTTGTESTDLMELTNVATIPLYTEDTAGSTVADILFFGNERLPVGTNGATFTVTQDETTPITVTDSFEWIYKDTDDETEVCGLKVKDETTLTAGDYTVTVTYSNLVKTFSFDVLETVSVTIDESTGTVTPQNKTLTDVILTAGTANSFYTNPNYTLAWVSSETDLNVNDYFKVKAAESDPKAFNLVYKGGLEARDTIYSVRVTAAGAIKSASADFDLTVVEPTVSLSPESGTITIGTESKELAEVTVSDFTPDSTVGWTFKLNDADTTYFAVDSANKLQYTGDGTLAAGTYTVTVIGSDGIDTASDTFTLTVVTPTVSLSPESGTITIGTESKELAAVTVSDFTPDSTVGWTFKLNDADTTYFAVDSANKLQYTGDGTLAAGTYTVTVIGSDGIDTASDTFALTVVTPTVSLSPKSDTITIGTESKELAAVTVSDFTPDSTVGWTFKLNDADTTYFAVDSANKLQYTGDGTLAAGTYTVTVIGSDGIDTASDTFALTVVTPTVSLSPESGTITDFTEKSELATVSLSNFIPANPINWTFKLEETVDTTHFSVDSNNKLIYNGDRALQPGEYTLEVIADNGIDSASDEYTLTIKECSLEVDTIFASITTNNHDLNIARLVPVNFPAGTTDLSLAWDRSEDIDDYFTVETNAQNQTYLHYKSGLAVGEYVIDVTATCTATNPDDGNVTVNASTKLIVTEPGVVASVVLDPTNKQIETTTAVNGFQLASVELQAFEDIPVITVQAQNTTAKDTNDELLLEDYSSCFTVVDGKLSIVQSDQTKKLVSGEYAVTVTATTYSVDNNIIQQASAEFILTLFDKKVETDNSNITIDFNTESNEFEIKDSDNPDTLIENGEANVLIVELKDTTTTPVITITNEAMKNLDAIHIESEVENVIIIEDAGESTPDVPVPNHFIIDSATDMYQDRPTAVTITANESDTDTETQIAKTTSSGTKSISITSTQDKPTQYDINTLSTNVLINTNADGNDIISFANGNSQAGIVLNLDKTEYGQSVYTGQQGTLTLNGTPGEVILSSGNDIVTGSATGSVITDTSDSWNTITLNGDSSEVANVVNLNSGATIIINGDASNKIVVENADKTILNLANATGTCDTTINGNNTTVTGGTGTSTINLTGDFATVNSPESKGDMTVNITGNGAIVKTGSGNDVIHVEGNDSLISSGAGNDTIYIEGNSNGNSISTGNGDDIVISTSTGGNTIYVDGGNDFIIGGDGRDRIFGGTGNSILAGGRGADRIIGGTARDIMLANISVNMVGKTPEQLVDIRKQLFETDNLDGALEILGTSSVADEAADSITRESENGIDVFFRNYLEGDTLFDVLEGDLIYD